MIRILFWVHQNLGFSTFPLGQKSRGESRTWPPQWSPRFPSCCSGDCYCRCCSALNFPTLYDLVEKAAILRHRGLFGECEWVRFIPISKLLHSIPDTRPWYFCLYSWPISMVNIGKHTSPTESFLSFELFPDISNWKTSWKMSKMAISLTKSEQVLLKDSGTFIIQGGPRTSYKWGYNPINGLINGQVGLYITVLIGVLTVLTVGVHYESCAAKNSCLICRMYKRLCKQIHPWSLTWKKVNQSLEQEIPFGNHHFQVPY